MLQTTSSFSKRLFISIVVLLAERDQKGQLVAQEMCYEAATKLVFIPAKTSTAYWKCTNVSLSDRKGLHDKDKLRADRSQTEVLKPVRF